MPLPDDYLLLLERLAEAFGLYETRTGFTPVLVGGAAAAIMTAGAFMSGDLDILAGDDDAIGRALLDAGFAADDRPGRLARGWFHPDHPRYGVELVSGHLFDGRAERDRLVRFTVRTGHALILPSPEDLIADRLGQHTVASPSDRSRLEQARLIARLAERLDTDYLRRRVVEEDGDPDLLAELRRSKS